MFWVARNDSSNSKRLVLAGSRIILQSRIIPKSTIPCGEYRVLILFIQMRKEKLIKIATFALIIGLLMT